MHLSRVEVICFHLRIFNDGPAAHFLNAARFREESQFFVRRHAADGDPAERSREGNAFLAGFWIEEGSGLRADGRLSSVDEHAPVPEIDDIPFLRRQLRREHGYLLEDFFRRRFLGFRIFLSGVPARGFFLSKEIRLRCWLSSRNILCQDPACTLNGTYPAKMHGPGERASMCPDTVRSTRWDS